MGLLVITPMLKNSYDSENRNINPSSVPPTTNEVTSLTDDEINNQKPPKTTDNSNSNISQPLPKPQFSVPSSLRGDDEDGIEREDD